MVYVYIYIYNQIVIKIIKKRFSKSEKINKSINTSIFFPTSFRLVKSVTLKVVIDDWMERKRAQTPSLLMKDSKWKRVLMIYASHVFNHLL